MKYFWIIYLLFWFIPFLNGFFFISKKKFWQIRVLVWTKSYFSRKFDGVPFVSHFVLSLFTGLWASIFFSWRNQYDYSIGKLCGNPHWKILWTNWRDFIVKFQHIQDGTEGREYMWDNAKCKAGLIHLILSSTWEAARHRSRHHTVSDKNRSLHHPWREIAVFCAIFWKCLFESSQQNFVTVSLVRWKFETLFILIVDPPSLCLQDHD